MGSLIGFQLCADFAENEPRWNPSRHVLRKLAFRAIQKIQNIAMTGKDRDILVKYLWGGFSVAWGDVVWDLVYSQEDHGGHKRGHVGPSLRISRLYAVEGRLTWKPRLDCEGDYRFPAVVVDVGTAELKSGASGDLSYSFRIVFPGYGFRRRLQS